jgi:hypothetical protein
MRFEEELQPSEVYIQLSEMTDAELIRFGNAIRRAIGSGANCGNLFVQLEEAHCEWHHRRNEKRRERRRIAHLP